MLNGSKEYDRGGDLIDLDIVIATDQPGAHYAGWVLEKLGARVRATEGVRGMGFLRGFLNARIALVGIEELAEVTPDLVIGAEGTEWGHFATAVPTVEIESGFTGAEFDSLPMSEILLAAAGGAAVYTKNADGTPVYGFGRRYQYITGVYAAIAGLALTMAAGSGGASRARVTALDAVVSVLPYATLQYAYNGSSETIEQSGPRFMCKCLDGYVMIYSGSAWAAQAALLERPDLLEDTRFKTTAERFRFADELEALFQEWSSRHTVAEAMEAARIASVAVAPALSLRETLADEQLQQYGGWESADSEDGPGIIPNAPYIVRDRHVGSSGGSYEPRGALPLEGLRILDLTHVWSGPMATRVLAGLGAEVLKVEGPTRWDFLRGSGTADVVRRYPDCEYGDDPHNRNAWFNTQNTDKKSVVLDLKHPCGVQIAQELASRSDAVISNMRPGALERCGLAGDEFDEINDTTVVVEMPGYGNEGPLRDFAGYGAQFEALSGASFLAGAPESPLVTGFALADPVAGLHAALAVLAGIHARQSSGRVPRIQAIQRDGMVALMGEYYLAESTVGAPGPGFNQSDEEGVHGIYRCGDGRYVAVDATGVEARSLVTGWVGSLPDRVGTEGGSESQVVAAWLQEQPSATVAAEELRTQGIPAVLVKTAGEVFSDSALRGRNYFTRLRHPSAGEHDHPSLPITINGQRCGPRTPAPRLDADTDAVVSELVGLGAVDVAALRAEGVIGI